ncbi:uncharacterized protein [Linepithema humile]|uniref:uncharacterized protein n=1 Tax=Linepithema humile TaxID=83485 RepID=UPI00351E6D51
MRASGLMCIIFLGTLMSATKTETNLAVEIERFSHEPGIYFEEVGEINVIESYWKFVITVDISALGKRHIRVQEWLELAESAKNTIHSTRAEKSQFANLLRLIRKDEVRITALLKKLKRVYGNPNEKKRGLIDGIGKVAKYLFGTMDAGDEKRINEQLTLLQNSESTFNHVTRHQLKILNSTIAHISDLEKTIDENNELLYDLDARIYNGTLLIIKREEINEYCALLDRMLADSDRDIQNVYDFLTQASHGMLNPSLLPVERIFAEMRAAAPYLPRGTYFPLKLDVSDWSTFEKITSVNSYVKNETIFVTLKLPLVTYPKYRLIKAIPLPVPDQRGIFVFTEINQQLFAVNLELSVYLAISEENLEKSNKT